MKVQFLRRRKLGNGSTLGIVQYLQEYGVDNVEVIRNDRASTDAPIVVRWGCTTNTGASHIINSSRGIHTVNTKDAFRKVLQDNGVSVPYSYFSKRGIQESPHVVFPLIGRPAHHAQGRNAVVCHSVADVMRDATSAYWSTIIQKEREFRVYCFFGKVIAVAEKVPDDVTQLLWNRAQGHSTFNNVRWTDWPINAVKEALKVHMLSNCDFEGVDVMTKGSTAYILESNSAPSLTTEYRKQCFAKAFASVIKTIRETGQKPAHATVNMGATSYREFIHPAIHS